jgi:hypothetical protein
LFLCFYAVLYTALLLPLVLGIKHRFKSYITKPKGPSQHTGGAPAAAAAHADPAAAAGVDGLQQHPSTGSSYLFAQHHSGGLSSVSSGVADAADVDDPAAAAAAAPTVQKRSSMQVMYSLGEEHDDDVAAAAAAGGDYGVDYDDSPLPPADFTTDPPPPSAAAAAALPAGARQQPKLSLRHLSTLLQTRLSNSAKFSASSTADSDAAAAAEGQQDRPSWMGGSSVKSRVTSTMNFTVQRWKSLKRGVKKRFWPKKRSTWVLLPALAVAAMSYCFAFYSSTVINAFTCMRLAGPPKVPGEIDLAGVNFWVPDLQLKCWSGAHLAVVAFAVLLGVPLLLGYAWLLLVLAWPVAKSSGSASAAAAAAGTQPPGLQLHSSLASSTGDSAAAQQQQKQQQQLFGKPSRRLIETESGPVTTQAAAAAAAKLQSSAKQAAAARGAATSPQAAMSTPFALHDSASLLQQQQQQPQGQGASGITPSSSCTTSPPLSPVPSTATAAAAAAAAPGSSSRGKKTRGLFATLWWFIWGLPVSIALRTVEKYVRKCQVHTVKRGVNGLQCAGLAVWNVQWRWWWLLLRELLKFAVIITANSTSMRQPPQVQALLVVMMVAFACFLTWQLMVGCTTSMERLLFTQCCWLQLLALLVLLLTLPGLNWSALGFVLLLLIVLKVLQDALMLALLVLRCVMAGRELSGLEGFADDVQ